MEPYKNDDFYMILPSSGSDNTYPDSTSSNFRTKLPETISFNKPWEVALSSLTFSNKINQFTSDRDKEIVLRLKPIIGRVKSEEEESNHIDELEIAPDEEDNTSTAPQESVEDDSSADEMHQPITPVKTSRTTRNADSSTETETNSSVIPSSAPGADGVSSKVSKTKKKDPFVVHHLPSGKKIKVKKVAKTSAKYEIGDTAITNLLVDIVQDNSLLHSVFLNNSFYSSIEDIISDLNKIFKAFAGIQLAVFSYDNTSKKVSVKISKLINTIKISQRLAIVLGFNESKFSLETTKEVVSETEYESFTADNTCDLEQGSTQIYIYCNIVASQIVGNTYAQLLYTLPLDHSQGNVLVTNPIRSYIAVDQLKFDNINILICNEFGDIIDFNHGSVVVGLHFRPRLKNGV